uniref:Uncharacterized protein n=1 Tax=Sphaerodactylus townsendi TaxID=933632 RepID=A0ACB8GBA5_9SAUR
MKDDTGDYNVLIGSKNTTKTQASCSDRGAEESLYAHQHRLRLCLHCGGEGHLEAVCPGKKGGMVYSPIMAKMKGATKGSWKKPPFKKGEELKLEPREVSSVSEEGVDSESSEKSAGNDSDLA